MVEDSDIVIGEAPAGGQQPEVGNGQSDQQVADAGVVQETAGEPQYVTREELEATKAALQETSAKMWQAYQSLTDKAANRLRAELAERMKAIEAVYGDPEVREYLGDEAQQLLERKKMQVIQQYFGEPPQAQPVPEPVNYLDNPIVQTTIALTDVRPGDPEWVSPEQYADKSHIDWAKAMQQAAERKKQRLAKTSVRPAPKQTEQSEPAVASPPAPEATPARKVAPVSMGTGEGPRSIDPLQAVILYKEARQRGDREEAARLEALIDAAARGKR